MTIPELVKKSIKDTGTKIEYAALMALIYAETGGSRGFDEKTGKIKIQFEPHKFRELSGKIDGQIWPANKIDVQSKEWPAFNEAFKIDSEAAMKATSIGLPQIMGFHWKRLGYSSVGEMWDDFKAGELNQVKALIRFIETDKRLFAALIDNDWHKVAMYYNGAGYMAIAYKQNREPYNVTMAKYYAKFSA